MTSLHTPRVLILGSGTPNGGGSGPRMLIDNIKSRVIQATIAGLVTHYKNGGVATLGQENQDLFDTFVVEDFPVRNKNESFSQDQLKQIINIYRSITEYFGGIDSIDFILLSGWMKYILDLPVEKVVNIHPARVDNSFGGLGQYGDYAHQSTFEAFQSGKILHSAITMHFVDTQFDHGPVIAQRIIPLVGCTSWQEAKSRVVGQTEHEFQLAVTRALCDGKVSLQDKSVIWDKDFEFQHQDFFKGEIDFSAESKL